MIIKFFDFILHVDSYIIDIVNNFGTLSYLIIGLIIFVETGLVFVPFLPGDSILFVVGLLCAQGSLNLIISILILIAAAVIGDTCNYFIGHYFGEKILENKKLTKKLGKHIEKTHLFFEKHGGLAIIYARFVPIVRTIAPFLAGISRMEYKKFLSYNISGGVLWILLLTVSGYYFGGLEIVKNNLTVIILGIVVVSILPMIYAVIKEQKK